MQQIGFFITKNKFCNKEANLLHLVGLLISTYRINDDARSNSHQVNGEPSTDRRCNVSGCLVQTAAVLYIMLNNQRVTVDSPLRDKLVNNTLT